MMSENNIAIIGCGTMGEALAQSLCATHKLFLYDRHLDKTKNLQQKGLGEACDDLKKALKQSSLIILAVKPKNLEEAARLIGETKLPLVSLLSGTSIERLKQYFPHSPILRMMPNLAITCGEGAIGLSGDHSFGEEEKKGYTLLFSALGKVMWIPEDKMDAFTSLAGSGPAFIFVVIEAAIEAGIAMGLKADEAQDIVQQMLKGSLHLLEHSGKHPRELIWQIASPGGTTIAGLKALEEHALKAAVINTFLATYARAKTMH